MNYDDYAKATQPDPADYVDDPQGYVDALAKWSSDQNGGSMFQPDSTFQTPSGETFSAAGTDRQESLPEYMANLLNTRYAQAQAHPGTATSKMLGLALSSRAGVRPDEMTAAYKASRPDGSQMLNPALAEYLASLGISLDAPPVAADPDAGVTDPDLSGPVAPGWVDVLGPDAPINNGGQSPTAPDLSGPVAPGWINILSPTTPDLSGPVAPGWSDLLLPGGQLPAGGHPQTPVDPTTPNAPMPDAANYQQVLTGNYPEFIKQWYLKHLGGDQRMHAYMSNGPGQVGPVAPTKYNLGY